MRALAARARKYYEGKLKEHGPTFRGMDWNSEESQKLRFQQLLKVVDGSRPCSILDYGCGSGALAGSVEGYYVGYDVSPLMIAQAKRLHPGKRFSCRRSSLKPCDYAVASGVLNVKQDAPKKDWERYALGVIADLDRLSRRGFAFNALTSYSDPDRRRRDLYYADPRALFDLCRRKYGKDVAVLHDYGLYEFTILVRKEGRRL